MPSHLDRALLLYHQSRFDMAAQELNRVLAETPHDGRAHSLLGLCLMRQDKLPEAQEEVNQAVALAPDEPFSHYCRSIVLEHRNRLPEAETAAREALNLDTANADYYAQLGGVLFRQKKWQAALDMSLEGLKFDAEHAGCTNLRSMALTQLGYQHEAIASADMALARDPDSEYAHTNKGWALLHEGKPKEALEHFREALRLDPNYQYAQHGIVEALKARNIIYRWMLAYFLWMSRLSDRAKWGVILGGYFGARFLRSVARTSPELEPWIAPLLIAYFVFVMLTWFAVPLFNLLLRFNKFGRHALSRDQRTSSNWFSLCLCVFIAGVVGTFAFDSVASFYVAGYGLGMALPLVTIYHLDYGWPRKMMTLYALGMAAIGAATITAAVSELAIAEPLSLAFLLGIFASPWVANALAGVTVKR
jgi:tetratricopeptide (TPR) repeat protein